MQSTETRSGISAGSSSNGKGWHSCLPAAPRRGMRWGRALGALLCALTALHCGDPMRPAAVAPVALALSPSNVQVAHGTAQAFTVQGLFADGQSQDVTAHVSWSLRDAAGRALPTSEDGILAFAQPGRYTVTAAYAGRSLTTPVTVTLATITALAVSPTTPSVPKGTATSFTATATFSDGTTQDVTKLAAWSVKDTVGSGVATVDTTGVTKAAAAGKTRVSARYLTKSASTTLEVTPAVLVTLAVSPSSPTIAKGTTQLFTAQGSFSDGTVTDLSTLVTWAVADVMGSGVAAIDGSGKAFGRALGVATVSAEYLGTVTETPLTVTAVSVSSLTLTPGSAALPKGTTQSFTAVANLTDGTTQDVTAVATWTAADLSGTGVAAVDSRGTARANSIGKARISVAYSGKSADAELEVTAAVLTKFTVEPKDPTVAVGLYQRLRALGTFSDGTTQDLSPVTIWTATDVTGSGVASVDAVGRVHGKARGQSRIDATYHTSSASVVLDIIGEAVTALTLTPTSATVGKGATQQFTATASLSDGSTQEVTALGTWVARDVSGTGVASIDSKGLARATAAGTAELKANYAGFTATAQLTVSEFALIASATTSDQWSIWGSSDNNIWSGGAAGTLQRWDGTRWTRIPVVYSGAITSIYGSGANDVWFGREDGDYLRWDGSRLSLNVINSIGTVRGIWGASATNYWIIGSEGLAHGTALSNAASGNAIWGSSSSDLWVVSDKGRAVHSGGFLWTSVATTTGEDLLSVSGSGSRDVWAVGTNGTILHYNGTAFSKVPSPKTTTLFAVASRGPSDAWIAGADGTILHWDGSSWVAVTSPTTQSLLGVWLGPSSVWMVGVNGVTIRR